EHAHNDFFGIGHRPQASRRFATVQNVNSPLASLIVRDKGLRLTEQCRQPKGAAVANVPRTKWSPKWSRTSDHERIFNETKRHARPIFAIQINTCRDRKKRSGRPSTNLSQARTSGPREQTVTSGMGFFSEPKLRSGRRCASRIAIVARC